MPRITVDWLEGRSREQRDAMARDMTQAVVENAKVRPDQVTIVFNEHLPKHQYKAGKNFEPIV